MAIFEKSATKQFVDDTEKFVCTLERAQNVSKHTEYILRIQKGLNKENKWTISRRYRDFAALQSSIQGAGIDLPLPPKKLIGNMQPSFIAERQIALQNYINEILKHQILALSLQVRRFLDPNNYPMNIAEQALQTVSIALRGDGRYELKGSLGDIGWRIRKHNFLVTHTESKEDCILSYQNYGPDRHLSDKDMQSAFKSLQNLNHPYIDQILAVHSLESGAYVVRRIHDKGTVKDMLYSADYTKNYIVKYGNPKIRKPFTSGQIAHYGYQILLALKFLHEKGLGHGHVHPGNIAIESQKALLLDIENFIVGAPSLHRPHLMNLRNTSSLEAVDVYCFGRTIYEMAFAESLETYYCDNNTLFDVGISEDLLSVLLLCLSSTSVKHGGPTLDHLLHHPFFTRSLLNGLTPRDDTRAHLKFPIALKEELRIATEKFEARLRTEQKAFRGARREVRIKEILNSEEEIKKLKRRAKKRDSVWKSTSSLAETVNSQSASTASSPTPPHHSHHSTENSNGQSSAAGCSSPDVRKSCTSPERRNTCTSPDTQIRRSSDASSATNGDGRSALLSAICSFDKSRLTRVSSHS